MSSITLSPTQPYCAECSGPFGKRQCTVVVLPFAPGEPAPKHDGPHRMFKQRVTEHGDGRGVVTRVLWDRRSWIARYHPFCTLRCALAYARKAHARRFGRHLRLLK